MAYALSAATRSPTGQMTPRAFDLKLPKEVTTSVVFASPHSGRDYRPEFLEASILDDLLIRSSEDAFVDHLFQSAPEVGAPLLAARVPRAYIDLNRSEDELDPAVVQDVRRPAHNPRIASGLGVIPRVVANGRAIYSGKIPLREAEHRIATGWHPYHNALRQQLAQAHRRFGRAILIDCHSMPHEAVDCVAKAGQRRPDVVIGDRFGAAADGEIVALIETIFAQAGLNVLRNTPFAGAYVTQQYGRPTRNQHAIQIEIDRSLYMDEAAIKPRADFAEFQALIAGIVGKLADIGRDTLPLAAE
jgi:N-formylglutamate amidohydrolase